MNHNLFVPEIEKSILGSILIDNDSIEKAITFIKPECFYNDENKKIYSVMLKLYSSNLPIDAISIYEEIKKEKIEELIPAIYISKLTESVSSSAKIEFYCKILFEKWFSRKFLATLDSIKEKIENNREDIFQIHTSAINDLEAIGDEFQSVNTIEKSLWEELPETLSQISERATSGEGGLKSTTFPTFNKIIGGLRESDLVCVFGKYKSGKSTFAIQLAIDFAISNKVPIGIFSLEMDKESLYLKALSMRTGIDYLKLRNPKDNKLTQEDLQIVQSKAAMIFKDSKIYIADRVFDKNRIKAKMKAWQKQFSVKFFVVDYLNLILTNQKAERRDIQIGEISRFFKLASKELSTPILMLTQENENGTTSESKALMRDADFVFRVSKPKEEGDTNYSEDDFLIQLLHSRHGKNGWSFVTRFVNENFVEIDKRNNLDR
jgi:replicative DNA helicase